MDLSTCTDSREPICSPPGVASFDSWTRKTYCVLCPPNQMSQMISNAKQVFASKPCSCPKRFQHCKYSWRSIITNLKTLCVCVCFPTALFCNSCAETLLFACFCMTQQRNNKNNYKDSWFQTTTSSRPCVFDEFLAPAVGRVILRCVVQFMCTSSICMACCMSQTSTKQMWHYKNPCNSQGFDSCKSPIQKKIRKWSKSKNPNRGKKKCDMFVHWSPGLFCIFLLENVHFATTLTTQSFRRTSIYKDSGLPSAGSCHLHKSVYIRTRCIHKMH